MKIIGAILILCASVCSCAFYERAEKLKLNNAVEICDFIKHIKAQIEYFSTPLSKIFSSYEPKSDMISAICNKSFSSIKGSFEKCDFKIIYEYFSSAGRGLKDEELSNSAYAISELEKSIEKKRGDLPNKIKVFRAMALFVGFCIIILLV